MSRVILRYCNSDSMESGGGTGSGVGPARHPKASAEADGLEGIGLDTGYWILDTGRGERIYPPRREA